MFPSLMEVAPALADEACVDREVWRGRAALARHLAGELREQVRVSVWFARRQLAYRRWLVGEAHQGLTRPEGGARVPAPLPADVPAG